jgi:hypothetical protein
MRGGDGGAGTRRLYNDWSRQGHRTVGRSQFRRIATEHAFNDSGATDLRRNL